MVSRLTLALAAMSLACLAGCSVTLRAGAPAAIPDDALQVRPRAAERCVHGVQGRPSPYRALAGPVTDPALLPYLEPIPDDIRRTATAAGIEPLLANVLREQARRAETGETSLEFLAMREQLSARMFALATQLTAMEFEVECVHELIDDALDEYRDRETDRQFALTIASLVVGAGASLAASIWALANDHTEDPVAPDGPPVTSILGAIATTALGISVSVVVPREIVYVHEHNVLTAIVSGENDVEFVYPSSIWNLLTMPTVSGAPTPRDELVRAWAERMAESVPPAERPLAERIVFGEGGVYDPALLEMHHDFIKDLGAALSRLSRDIDMLGRTVSRILEADSTPIPH